MPCNISLCLLIALAVLVAPGAAAADGFVLVCNARGSPASLSRAEVRALYTGKVKTLGGSIVVVVVRGEDDALFGAFVDQTFGIPTRALLAKIRQEVFKGEMTKPINAASDDDVIRAVAASPGVIGVISSHAAGHLPKTVTAAITWSICTSKRNG